MALCEYFYWQGPLVSAEQLDRVCAYAAQGVKDGARLLAGGNRAGGAGFFMQPTVFADVKPNMSIVRVYLRKSKFYVYTSI